MTEAIINVKFFEFSKQSRPLSVPAGSTVGDVLRRAEVSLDDREIRVNGKPASEDAVLEEGSTVMLLAQVEGNAS